MKQHNTNNKPEFSGKSTIPEDILTLLWIILQGCWTMTNEQCQHCQWNGMLLFDNERLDLPSVLLIIGCHKIVLLGVLPISLMQINLIIIII